MNKPIETIIFDLGRVIIGFDHHLVARNLSKISDFDETMLFDLIFTSGLEISFGRGEISPEEFYNKIGQEVKISFEKFKTIWNDIFFPPKEEMVKLLGELKGRYKLYLLSNTNALHFEYVKNKYEILEIFEEYILSYQVGVSKPDKRIYLEALARSNSPPERCIYIDDIKEFAEAATKVGMKGIHFEGAKKLRRKLQEYGVSC